MNKNCIYIFLILLLSSCSSITKEYSWEHYSESKKQSSCSTEININQTYLKLMVEPDYTSIAYGPPILPIIPVFLWNQARAKQKLLITLRYNSIIKEDKMRKLLNKWVVSIGSKSYPLLSWSIQNGQARIVLEHKQNKVPKKLVFKIPGYKEEVVYTRRDSIRYFVASIQDPYLHGAQPWCNKL